MGFIDDKLRSELSQHDREREAAASSVKEEAIDNFCKPDSLGSMIKTVREAAVEEFMTSRQPISRVHLSHLSAVNEWVSGNVTCEHALLNALKRDEPSASRVSLTHLAGDYETASCGMLTVWFNPPLS
jgi:hypothetical protein